MFKYFFSENYFFMRQFEKFGNVRHGTHNKTRRKRFACRLDRARDKYRICTKFLFHVNKGAHLNKI